MRKEGGSCSELSTAEERCNEISKMEDRWSEMRKKQEVGGVE